MTNTLSGHSSEPPSYDARLSPPPGAIQGQDPVGRIVAWSKRSEKVVPGQDEEIDSNHPREKYIDPRDMRPTSTAPNWSTCDLLAVGSNNEPRIVSVGRGVSEHDKA